MLPQHTHLTSIYKHICGDPGESCCPDTKDLNKGLTHNGSTPYDLTKLPVIFIEHLLICMRCIIQNSSCDTNKWLIVDFLSPNAWFLAQNAP